MPKPKRNCVRCDTPMQALVTVWRCGECGLVLPVSRVSRNVKDSLERRGGG